jgi:hypothetical protein
MRRILVIAALLASTTVHAQTYTDVWNDVQGRSNFELDYALNVDSTACEGEAGPQWGHPSVKYRKCMRAHGWTYSHLTKNHAPSNTAAEEEASRTSQQNADEISRRIDDVVRQDDEMNAAAAAASLGN